MFSDELLKALRNERDTARKMANRARRAYEDAQEELAQATEAVVAAERIRAELDALNRSPLSFLRQRTVSVSGH